jgi:hypothetical protein
MGVSPSGYTNPVTEAFLRLHTNPSITIVINYKLLREDSLNKQNYFAVTTEEVGNSWMNIFLKRIEKLVVFY